MWIMVYLGWLLFGISVLMNKSKVNANIDRVGAWNIQLNRFSGFVKCQVNVLSMISSLTDGLLMEMDFGWKKTKSMPLISSLCTCFELNLLFILKTNLEHLQCLLLTRTLKEIEFWHWFNYLLIASKLKSSKMNLWFHSNAEVEII